MGQNRYVRTAEQLAAAEAAKGHVLESTVQQIVIDYKTDLEVAKAVLPPPLEVNPEGLVRVVLSHITMHLPGFDMTIGAGTVGVHANYKDTAGYHIITMPMTMEGPVVKGRETYGEPKKLADIPFSNEDGKVKTSITRMGITYLDCEGTIGAEKEARVIADKGFCYKVFPSVTGSGLEYDPLLVQLNLTRKQKQCFDFDAKLTLNESPYDPVVDLPILEIVNSEFELVDAESNGEALQTVPAADFAPYVCQRYDT